mgnify:FL=1
MAVLGKLLCSLLCTWQLSDSHCFIVVIEDNHGQSQQLDFKFNNEDDEEKTATTEKRGQGLGMRNGQAFRFEAGDCMIIARQGDLVMNLKESEDFRMVQPLCTDQFRC